MRGYFEIGIYMGKTVENIGTLWRSAFQLGASDIFTIGRRYQHHVTDTVKSYLHIPLRHYENFDQFFSVMPNDCKLVGVEMGGETLGTFVHPERAIYLLGAEDFGLPKKIIEKCHGIVSLEAIRVESFNVSVAGSIVMYDRAFSNKALNRTKIVRVV